ncbi:uncharacterized protein J4E78_003773 [Alternaria triticimaculans]|uniref:uncharacterized protein n=1 Tax=Alternaria triticimaculans TaxID=297637 RepID=UPI0020C27D1B|nr:uncharacterized protein J4E78_003773 [Alternaria triticimaculans]KAI4663361.1 hypothetical protein J4E78_003773 [Alternaria triticimaculans]
MADPFSITGSAVGVVSLAIQVCKGLEWYLSGVKEAKNKAEQITAETEQLANLLELLESTISKVDQSNSVSATRTGIVSCAHAIATIRKKLKPDDEAVNGGMKSSLKRLTKRLAFPFKEAEIRYWKDVLNTVQQSLQTALSALLIDQQRLAFEDVQARFMQLSMEQSAQHYASLQLQCDGFNSTSFQLAGHSHIVETGFLATSHSLQNLHTGIHSLQAKLDEISLMTDSTLDTDIINMRSLHRKDRRLKQRYGKLSCTCRPQTSALGYQTRRLAITYARTSMHDPGCPQAPLQNAMTDLQLQATLCSLLLRKKVLLSFQLSYGAGLSVKQNLELLSYHASRQFMGFHTSLLRSLFEQDLQMTRSIFMRAAFASQEGLAVLAQVRYESFTSPLLDDSELLEAIVVKSDRQLQEFFHQPKYLYALDADTIVNALIMSTVTGWMDGCRVLLNANLVGYLEDPDFELRYSGQTLLMLSAATNQPDMLQFWLSQRETHDGPLLKLIGHFEDALHFHWIFDQGTPGTDVIPLVSSYLLKQRHEFPLLCDRFKNTLSARELGKLRVYAIDDYVESRYELFTGTFLDLTLWVDRAANTLGLSRLIHDYIRLFVFSYLEIQHTCCDITRISRYRGNPDSSEQPYPRYPPTKLRRITNEDAHLRARLEELVPELISQYDSFGGQLQDFVIDVLIPTMRRTAKELKEEDKTL